MDATLEPKGLAWVNVPARPPLGERVAARPWTASTIPLDVPVRSNPG